MIHTPITILMTTDAVGGVWTYAMELCRALPSVRFVLANMGPSPSQIQRDEVSELPHVQLEEGDFKLEWMDDPWTDIEHSGAWLLKLARHYQPDLIHLNGYIHASLPWEVPVMIVGHSCVLSWWMAVKHRHVPNSWNRYAAAVTEGLLTADQVVVPSRAMGTALVTHYNIPVEPLVILNGRDTDSFRGDEPKEHLILSAGRLWDEAKNVPCLAKAVAGLSWPLVLAGELGGSNVQWSNVHSIGQCDHSTMQRWFRKAAIYAHPARYEPFGLAPLEAAQAGCALVLADIPSLREIWGDSAIYVHPEDPAAWRRALLGLIQEPEKRDHLTAKSMEHAKAYSRHEMAQSYFNLYRDLLRVHQLQFPICS